MKSSKKTRAGNQRGFRICVDLKKLFKAAQQLSQQLA